MKSLFLTESQFLDYFTLPAKFEHLSVEKFAQQTIVTYRYRPTLQQVFDVNHPKTVIKHPEKDNRPLIVDKVIDFFYQLLITQRKQYLKLFYQSYFTFKDPSELKWSGVDLWMSKCRQEQVVSPLLNQATSIWNPRFLFTTVNDNRNLPTISIQRNDHCRALIRNVYHLELLRDTRVTNTCKSDVSFWQTLLNAYNNLILPDRLLAPSSLGLLFRESNYPINYQNFFYMLQQYQPKASIINPYVIAWIMRELVGPGQVLFTPVLSWSAYLLAYMFVPDWNHYIGVDVIPEVCCKSRALFEHYCQDPSKTIDIRCCPSESLATDQQFLDRYSQQVDLVIVCPPYYRMELYQSKNQSVDSYPDYHQWLASYWEPTIEVCAKVLKKGGHFLLIINDYQTLHPKTYYPLIADMNLPLLKYFQLQNIIRMGNRKSPMRRHSKDRSEKLFIWCKV